VIAAAGLLVLAVFNLSYGLPESHARRWKVLKYIMSQPQEMTIPTSGKSYAIRSREGRFLPSVDEAVASLNAGIEEDQRHLQMDEKALMSRKIMKINSGKIDVCLLLAQSSSLELS
jgi:hypothetical protein